MAKDIKLIKGSDEIVINENNLAHYEKLGYKVLGKETNKNTKEKKSWQPITEKKVSSKQEQM